MKCSVNATGGSVDNVNKVTNNELDFAIAQNDVLYDKANANGSFKDDANSDLRAVVSLYPELLTLVVAKERGIKTYKDLVGKNINLGNPGSGNEVTAKMVLKAYKIDPEKLGNKKGDLDIQKASAALRKKEIDGYFFVAGHPNRNITRVANTIAIDLISIDNEQMKELLEKYPYFVKGLLPANIMYQGVNHDTQTIGVKAVLFTHKNQDDESVKILLKSILDNFDEYKSLNSALRSVTKESLIEGMSLPLHPAAEQVFKEAGIIKEEKSK